MMHYQPAQLSEVYMKIIASRDPDILGGTAVFAGTRVPLSVLFENLADGLTLDEILDSYPTIPRDMALLALEGAESAFERDQAPEQ